MPLRIENLFYTYSKGTPFEKQALYDINLDITDGEFVGIIGHTGCGKSTLVQHFNGLLKPVSGRIYIDDILMNNSTLSEMRKKVGLVFQYPEYQLFEETVYKDIAFGLRKERLTDEEKDSRIRNAAEIVGLPQNLLDRSIYDLSGGQKRRAAIAGIIVMSPRFLVLDEPAAGLDPVGRNEILSFCKRLKDERGTTIILVSHSMEDIAKYADKVIVMNKGNIIMNGCPKDVFTKSEQLEGIGLSVPQITTLITELRKYYPEIPNDIITVDDAVKELLHFIRGGICK